MVARLQRLEYTYFLLVEWFAELELLMCSVFLDLRELEKNKVQLTNYYTAYVHASTRG